MLIVQISDRNPGFSGAGKKIAQRGVVLIITLIVLVAMTLAGIALVRSVGTANIIAGNLAFQKSASYYADVGIETATDWLEAQSTANRANLYNPSTAAGYRATNTNPVAGQTWANWWAAQVGAGFVRSLAQDATTGNQVAYLIERMCPNIGAPAGCDTSPPSASGSTSGGSSKSNAPQCVNCSITQIYFRITSRIAGPRNTVSYVQAIIAL